MTFPESCQYLETFINYEAHLDCVSPATFSLERISRLLNELGNPQKKFKAIHVAGTKGKGSTCTLAAGILSHHGFRVGLYTSPHLIHVRERIQCLDVQKISPEPGEGFEKNCISEEDFSATLERVRRVLDQMKGVPLTAPTYFEVLTALAFCYFEQAAVDYVVLETGLGGRLDATNVVEALACGITPVGLEHTKILGGTLTAIATEKAAIIKSAVPVIVAPQKQEALAVIENRCREMRAKPYFAGKEIIFSSTPITDKKQKIVVQTPQGHYEFFSPLLGDHQALNAAVAIGLVESLPAIGKKILPEAVSRAGSEWFLPGRFHVVHQEPCVILDVAHTPESMAAVRETIKKVFPGQKVTVVLGLSNDKNAPGILTQISQFSHEVIWTRAQHPRSMDFIGAGLFAGNFRITSQVAEAIDMALATTSKEDVILVTGSFFVVAEAAKQFPVSRFRFSAS